jgi:hypothetical protein
MTDGHKALGALKATVIDDDSFRLLAIPFGGPIGRPGTSRYIAGLPNGYDLDRQAFELATDIKPKWLTVRLVDWHHRDDPHPASMGDAIVGKAVDLGDVDGASDEPDEDGWWVTFWLKQGARRRETIRLLAKATDPETDEPLLYGSSETAPGMGKLRTLDGKVVPWKRSTPGTIVEWPYLRQTLSTSPQNTLSVLRPLKATLSDLWSAGESPADAFFDDLSRLLDNLAASPVSDLAGDDTAKAGRVLAARNEARLRAGIDELRERGWDTLARKRAIAKFAEVLDELSRYIEHPEETSP